MSGSVTLHDLDAFYLGCVRVPIGDYQRMCWQDLDAIRQGWEMGEDREWERTLLMVNAWTGAGLTLDKLKGGGGETVADRNAKYRELMKMVEGNGRNG